MIERPPLPDNVAVHIDFDDSVGRRVPLDRRVGARGHGLFPGHWNSGREDDGPVIEMVVPDPLEVVMVTIPLA